MKEEEVFTDPNDQEIYAIALMAIRRRPSYDVICSSSLYWLSLARLYEVLRRHKEIEAMTDLPREQKLRYWLTAMRCRPEKPKWVKVMICQALYVFDVIQNKTGSYE